MRADFGITYDVDAMKLIDDLAERGLQVRAVVITRYDNQPAANIFKNKLERQGVRVYTHRYTKGYPTDVDLIVSEEGYGANTYIETQKQLIIVTGPGPGSGKLTTCLSQLYHEHKRGVRAGYAKFETFPIWNISLKHPVNVAYEAATADIRDFNMIDPFHLEAYGESAVNYNRDVEVFPVLRRILERITGTDAMYKSPTDMGVNRAGFGITDIPDVIHLLSTSIVESITQFKKNILNTKTMSLDLDETLISLAISAATNPTAQICLEQLPELKGCEVHMTHMPTPGDEAGLRRLGVNLTSEPIYSMKGFIEVRGR